MKKLTKVLIPMLALLAVCAPFAYGHDSDESSNSGKSHMPKVNPKPASAITSTGATLNAQVDPRGDKDDDWWIGQTAYRFQYGTSTAYTSATALGYLSQLQDKTTVSAPVTGLSPATTYVYRVIAGNNAGTVYSPAMSFKTPATSTAKGPKSPKGSDGPAPALGQTVVAAAASGTVMVRERGSGQFVPLDQASEVPVNSTFDATNGTVRLKAARGGGESNTGTFHGGIFKVHQSRNGDGMTHLALRGGDFSSCESGAASRAVGSGPKTLRKLWGKDHGGRFKTSGRGSVATVRGTVWYTADTCDGTLTKVKKGAVMVRERGTGRHELLHKGESFFAHLPS